MVDRYFGALGGQLASEQQAPLLLHLLGREGRAQYVQAVASGRVTEEVTFAAVREQLGKLFASKSGLTAARLEFLQRQQQPGESVDEFVGDLRKLVARCNFASFTSDNALVIQMIAGTSSSRWRERLLAEEDKATAESAVDVGRAIERC